MAQDPETLYDTAQRLVGEGKLAAAEVLLRQAVDMAQDPNLYLAGLGTLLGLQEGRTEESVEILQEQLEHFPDNPTLLVAYGMTLNATGKEEEAEKAFRDAVEKDPNHPAALNSLAQVVLSKGDVAAAEKMACKAFALAPDHADFALMAHAILEAQGKVDLAYEVASVGATYNPTDMDLVQKAVEGALARDDAERAWDILKDSNEDVSWVIGWKATLLDLQGDAVKADELLGVGRRLHTNNPNFLFLEAAIHQRRGDAEKALAVVNQVLAIDPEYAGAYQLKAELGAPPAERVAALEKVREAAPEDPGPRADLMAAYYSARRYADAYAVCSTILQTEEAPDIAFIYAALSLAALDQEESLGFIDMLPDESVPLALSELEKYAAGTDAEAALREALADRLLEAEGEEEPLPEVDATPEPESEPEDPSAAAARVPIPTGGPDFSGFFPVKDIEDPIYEEDDEDDDDDDYDDEDYEYVDDDDDDYEED